MVTHCDAAGCRNVSAVPQHMETSRRPGHYLGGDCRSSQDGSIGTCHATQHTSTGGLQFYISP